MLQALRDRGGRDRGARGKLIERPERRLWFDLSLELGIPVAEAQERVSSREFAEWIAYDRISPIGPKRLDLVVANAAMRIAAAAYQGKQSRRFTVQEFLPPWTKRGIPAPSGAELRAKALAFARQYNASRQGGR